MGGLGSGERLGPVKRQVEDCDTLDTALLRRWGWLVPGDARGGTITWRRGREVCGEIGLTANLMCLDAASVWLSYTLAGERLDHRVLLDSTTPRYGGLRWWFLCPLVVRGIACERRVRKLYRVGRYFGCRHCHDLTYKSRQEHDARVSRLMKDPGQMRAMIDSESIEAILLGMTAAARLEERNRRVGGDRSR
jgi:hypothetical protein